jgi:hypothetical protein
LRLGSLQVKKKTLETAWLPFSKVYPKQPVFLPVRPHFAIPESKSRASSPAFNYKLILSEG